LAAALGIRRLVAELKIGGEYLMQPRRADFFLATALEIRRLAEEQKVGGH